MFQQTKQPQVMPGGGAGAAQGAEQIGPDQAKAVLINVLQRAKQLADKYNLDLTQLVGEVASGGGAKTPPAPMVQGQAQSPAPKPSGATPPPPMS